MRYSVWKKDGTNEYVCGTYTYHYFTDSFSVSYIKEDKNIDEWAWFEFKTYSDDINFGSYKNIDKNFDSLKKCHDYIVEHHGVNLSFPTNTAVCNDLTTGTVQ
jgi:hypothetical protein